MRYHGLTIVAACLVLACGSPGAQRVDRSKPPTPTPVASTEGFAASRLSAPPTIDGRTWIEAKPVFGPARVSAPNGQFVLTLEAAKPNEDTGDLAGYRVYFAEGQAAPVETARPSRTMCSSRRTHGGSSPCFS
jgi:hypothetical protein